MRYMLPTLTLSLGILLTATVSPQADSTSSPVGHVSYADGREVELVPGEYPFGQGEVLDYDLKFGVVKIGRARMETSLQTMVEGKPVLEIFSRGKSVKWVDSIYMVRDEIRSLVELETMHSLSFSKHLNEGKYKKELEVEFDHQQGKASYQDGELVELVPGSHDILSALYYIRWFSLEVGMTLKIPVHDGKKNYALEVEVLRREKVKIPLGEFDCLVLEPRLKSQGLFKSEGRMWVYISDDKRHLPVLLKAKAPVGAFTSELKGYQSGKAITLPVEAED
jgi:hypothetical protein